MHTMPATLIALLLTIAPAAAATPAPDVPLFTDPAGDAGPGTTWGLPGVAPASYGDLTGAIATAADGHVEMELALAELPATLPPDTVWALGWKQGDDHVSVGWANLVTTSPEHAVIEGAFLCTFADGDYGEPDCEPVPGERTASGFRFVVPWDALDRGVLQELGGAVVHVPDATAWPLFLVHFTGMTIVDWAEGGDVDLQPPSAGNDVTVASHDTTKNDGTAVPGLGALGLLVGLGAGAAVVAVAWRRR